MVAGAGAGRCCWMAARGGGAEQGSVLGMRRLKSRRCQTAGQKSGRWPSERAAGLGRRSATLASPAAAQRGPRPLPPKHPTRKNPPRPSRGRPPSQPRWANACKKPRDERRYFGYRKIWVSPSAMHLRQGAACESAPGIERPVPPLSPATNGPRRTAGLLWITSG